MYYSQDIEMHTRIKSLALVFIGLKCNSVCTRGWGEGSQWDKNREGTKEEQGKYRHK